MSRSPLLLLVEDDELLAKVYLNYLGGEQCELAHVVTGKAALAAIEERRPEIVLLDLLLPDIHGIEILKYIRESQLDIMVIVATTEASAEVAVQAMRAGAFDYFVKPVDRDRLVTTVHNALERIRLQHRLAHYEAALTGNRFEGFIGTSPVMRATYQLIGNAAVSNAGVFITGESGTGKELCAEAIHRRSGRRGNPLVTVNCAAIPRGLMESELFGHKKGAFTGASANRTGAAAQADGGTLFFDEICEMDLGLQAKLLRFIQTRRFQPVGADQQEITDVRFVCATNRDPATEVQAGRFREDLYYRLYVVPIELPPLRARGEDILLLTRHFLEEMAKEEGKSFDGFSAEAEQRLLEYHWPGNVRQLVNLVQNLVVRHPSGTLSLEMLIPLLGETKVPGVGFGKSPTTSGDATVGGQVKKGSVHVQPFWMEERRIIEQAIELCGGNVPDAARRLEISDSTIYRKRRRWLRAD